LRFFLFDELIDMVRRAVDCIEPQGFLAGVLSGFEGHQHKLQVLAGIEDLPIGIVFFCQFFDIGEIALPGVALSKDELPVICCASQRFCDRSRSARWQVFGTGLCFSLRNQERLLASADMALTCVKPAGWR
jgi:hypothetical protein